MRNFKRYLNEDDNPNLFDDLIKLVTLVAKGVRRSLFVYGGGGTGKTYTVIETLNSLGLKQNRDWYIFSGKLTTLSLYKQLFLLRRDKILVFDDADESFNNPDSAAILKAALDTSTRTLNWFSARTTNVTNMSAEEKENFYNEVEHRLHTDPSDDSIKFPSEFIFTSRVIFISNEGLEHMDKAVLTRLLKINMGLDPSQMFKRMAFLIHQGKLGPADLSEYEKIEILNHLIRLYNHGQLPQPSLRTFVAASQMVSKGISNWQNLLKYS